MPLTEPTPRHMAVLSLTPSVALGVEVGADHGMISAHLLQSGICSHMIVSDISGASLEKARRLFMLHGLEDAAEFRVADGLDALRDSEAGAVVIAGMGARTIASILHRGKDKIGGAALILQPNIDLPGLRRWLMDNGFTIDAERLVRDGRRFYIVLRAVPGVAAYTERELLLGPCLLDERSPLFIEYLAWRHDCLACMQSEEARRWATIVREELGT